MLKWTIQQLNQYRHKGLPIDETIDLSELKRSKNDIRDLSPVHVSGKAEFSGNKITFDLHIKTVLVLPCARTLVDVEHPIDLKVREVFDLNPSEYAEEDDEEVHPVFGETLDLTPFIRENILLEIPMQVFSKEAQVEKAPPQAGEDWEVLTEEEKRQQIDPRLADLKKFFEND